MRGLIYESEQEAITDNESLSDLNHKPIEYLGSGIFADATQKPYTNMIKHPIRDEWALVSNDEIDSFLNKKSIELDSTWFTLE